MSFSLNRTPSEPIFRSMCITKLAAAIALTLLAGCGGPSFDATGEAADGSQEPAADATAEMAAGGAASPQGAGGAPAFATGAGGAGSVVVGAGGASDTGGSTSTGGVTNSGGVAGAENTGTGGSLVTGGANSAGGYQAAGGAPPVSPNCGKPGHAAAPTPADPNCNANTLCDPNDSTCAAEVNGCRYAGRLERSDCSTAPAGFIFEWMCPTTVVAIPGCSTGTNTPPDVTYTSWCCTTEGTP